MYIHTLGSGHGDSTHLRFNSCCAYETADGKIYLVDAGAPAEALLRRKGLRIQDAEAVFITHLHDDHAGGLTGLCKQVNKYPRERNRPFTVVLPEEKAIAPFKMWFSTLHEDADSPYLRFAAALDGVVYEDARLTVTAVRTCHLRTLGRFEGDPCSFGYILDFKEEHKRILHTGDLCADFHDFPAIASEQPFDLCLCECTHYQPEDALPALSRARFARLIFNHIGDRWHDYVGPAWQVQQNEKALLAAFQTLPYPFEIAHDMQTFLL